MKAITPFRAAIAAAALFASLTSASAAFSKDVEYKITAGHYVIGDLTIDNITASGYVGEIVLSTTTPGYEDPWSTVCTDILGAVYLNQTYWWHDSEFAPAVPGLNPNWGADGQGAQAIQNAADVFNDRRGGATTAVDWAAIQLAVWEVLYDTGSTSGFDLSKGRFQVSANNGITAQVVVLAASYLRASDTLYVGNILIPLTSAGEKLTTAQEMLYEITPVPEPTTVIAAVLLLVPFGVSTLQILRRNRRARA